MQKILTTTLAAAGLLAASQISVANALAPGPHSQIAVESSRITPVRFAGGGGGGGGAMPHGGTTMGHPGSVHSFSMGNGPAIGHGGIHVRRFHHGNLGDGYEPFYGFGLDYGDPWDGGGSCYSICRSEGHGPRFCRAYAREYCD